MGLVLHQHSHTPGSHGHSHGFSSVPHSHTKDSRYGSIAEDDEKKTHKKHATNINVTAAFIHVVGDFVQSLGVLIAALIIYFEVCLFYI